MALPEKTGGRINSVGLTELIQCRRQVAYRAGKCPLFAILRGSVQDLNEPHRCAAIVACRMLDVRPVLRGISTLRHSNPLVSSGSAVASLSH